MNYPSDLSNAQWEAIKHHFIYENGYGNRAIHERKHMVNAIFYITKTGAQWRQMPRDFPKWKTVYSYYRNLCRRGTWAVMMDELVLKTRLKAGRSPAPSLASIDSQSTKTSGAAVERNFDGGKKNQRTKKTHRNRCHGEFALHKSPLCEAG